VEKARAAAKDKAEQVFGDLARGNSEDPVTARMADCWGRVVKKNPNKIDALYDRAVDMQPGDTTDPINTQVTGTYFAEVMPYQNLLKKRNRNCWFQRATASPFL